MLEPDAILQIQSQFQRSRHNYPSFNSPIEGWAVIFGELDELREEVFRKKNCDIENMRSEAAQVGAMALQFLVDLC